MKIFTTQRFLARVLVHPQIFSMGSDVEPIAERMDGEYAIWAAPDEDSGDCV